MRRLHLLLVLLLAIPVAAPVAAQRRGDFTTGHIVDLTYAFDANTVYWPTAEQFKLEN